MDIFEDGRGTIQDVLLEDVEAVTRITTKKGAIRGNHFHAESWQWTYVVSGTLDVYDSKGVHTLLPGHLWLDKPGEPHAWKAWTDCDVLVFTKGPRARDYEADTFPAHPPLVVL